MDRNNFLKNMVQFNHKTRPKKEDRKKKYTFDSISALYKGRELTLNAFKSGIFPIRATKGKGRYSDLASLASLARVAKVSDHSNLKILNPK